MHVDKCPPMAIIFAYANGSNTKDYISYLSKQFNTVIFSPGDVNLHQNLTDRNLLHFIENKKDIVWYDSNVKRSEREEIINLFRSNGYELIFCAYFPLPQDVGKLDIIYDYYGAETTEKRNLVNLLLREFDPVTKDEDFDAIARFDLVSGKIFERRIDE